MLHSVKRRYAGSYPHLSSAHARPDGEPIGRGTLVGKYQGSELEHGPTGLRLFTCRSDVRFGSLADISCSPIAMSPSTPKADIEDYGWNVRFVPIADICRVSVRPHFGIAVIGP